MESRHQRRLVSLMGALTGQYVMALGGYHDALLQSVFLGYASSCTRSIVAVPRFLKITPVH
jgi:hypothetical protein